MYPFEHHIHLESSCSCVPVQTSLGSVIHRSAASIMLGPFKHILTVQYVFRAFQTRHNLEQLKFKPSQVIRTTLIYVYCWVAGVVMKGAKEEVG